VPLPPELERMPRLTPPFNPPGHPEISVPCGFTSSGVPIGMSLVGKALDEARALRAARACEEGTDRQHNYQK
jgi:aspartyl-tRNA(Asn)/glutamyl-tRNA(Gln) amidotransferase subunit A